MKRFSTFLLTLMLVVFTSTAFAQGGPKRVVQTNPDFVDANGAFITGNYSKGEIATLGGVKCEVLSDNIVGNWSFEEGFTGWTNASDFTTEIVEPAFEQYDNVPKSGKYYLVGTKNSGAGDANSLGTAWAVEAGKTYYFSYWIKGIADDTNASWMKVSLVPDGKDLGTEPDESDTENEAWVINGVNPVGTEWQQVSALFTVPEGYSNLQVRFRWLNTHWGFDDFELYEVDTFEDIDPDYKKGDEVDVGVITYTLTSDNLIDNHSFELGLDGWYSANNTDDGHPVITSQYFDLARNGNNSYGFDTDSGKRYLVGTGNTGADGVASLYNAWEIEAGQTYYFSFDIRALAGDDPDAQFIVTSLVNSTNTAADADNKRPEDYGKPVDSGSGKATPSDEWKTVQAPFTNDEGYKYLQIDFRWLNSNFAFDNFQLYKADPGVAILTAHSEVGEFDHWSIAGNTGGSFQYNTWSTEADPSGMVQPFIEYWVGSGNKLSDATISHKTIFGLPAGNYTVSIDGRAFNENSLTAIAANTIFFNANGKSVDIATGTSAVYNNVSAEVYGTYTLDCEVGQDGILDINFSITGTNCDWFAFKNLKVEYVDADVPTVVALTDAMDATVKSAMDAAVEAYNSNQTSANFEAAITALQPAYASAAEYAEVAAVVEALDAAGLEVWEASTSASAYEAGTLTAAQTHADLAEAQAAQTTNGSDMTYVMRYSSNAGDWKDNAGTIGHPGFDGTYTWEHYGTASNKVVLYKTITGLAPGIYEVSFYANASNNSEDGREYITDGAKVYANDIYQLIDINQLTGTNYNSTGWRDADLHTITCVVNSSGELTYGIAAIEEGKWFIVMDSDPALNASLTLLSCQDTDSEYKEGDLLTYDGVDYEVVSDNLVTNHSFEQGVVNWYSTEQDANGNYIVSEISDENFAFVKGGASDGTWYIVGTEDGGKDSPLSLGNKWKLDHHATYYFSFDIKAETEATNATTLQVAMTNIVGPNPTEVLINQVTGVTSEWKTVETVFTNPDYDYLQMMFYELQGKWGFDNFQLYKLDTPTEVELVAHEDSFADNDAAAETLGHWTTTENNGHFVVNTWSGENDASGMVVPFIENWVGGATLSAATISHQTIVGLPEGVYDISMDIRLMSEDGLAMTKGTTFNANDASEDLVTGEDANAGVYGTETEFYGNYKLAATVGTDGLLDISIVIPEEGVTYNWIAFKNLKVSMTTTVTEDMPVIEALEGKMSADAEKAMTDAIAAYDKAVAADPLVVADVESTFTAAIDALQAAQESIEEYAELAALVDALDEAGKKVWDATESGEAYEAGTLTADDDWTADMADAVKSQTTEGADMTFGMLNSGEWIADQGNGPATYATTATETYLGTGAYVEGEVLYKVIDGLTPGVYEVTFNAVASCTSSRDANVTPTEGEGFAQIFANDATQDIDVIEQLACTPSDYPYTLTCIVDEDGVLTFGLQNIATGGNWYVGEEVSLIYLGAYVEPISDDEYAEGDNVEVDGQNYKITSGNLFVNGGFNDAINEDGTVPGWTCTNEYTDPLLAENVIIATAGGFNDGGYLTLKESVGASNEMTPTQAIKVTPGSTYLFIGYTNGTEPTDANIRYSALFAMQSATEESHHDENGTSFGDDIVILDWESDGEWTKTMAVFTATTDYVGMRMNWSVGSYDGFQLYEVNAPRITPGDYLVVNPETGNYLAGGLYWGTEAMEGGKPQFIGFEATDDGRYILDSYQSNGGDSHYIGVTAANEMYFDTEGCTWLVLKDVNTDLIYIGTEIVVGTEEVTDEKGEKVTQDVKGLRWVKSRDFQNAVEWVENVADCTPWTLVTKADVLATMEDATADEPVDVTALIPASEPKRNAWGASWTMTAYDGESTINNGTLGQEGNPASVAESWHSTNGFLFTQIVPDLPVGTYKLTAQAFYRNDIADESELVVPVMYADDVTAELPELPELTDEEIEAGITVPANMVDAYQAFLLEEYPVELMFYVAEEGDVEIGFSSELATNDQLWTIFGELGLLYYGEENLTEPEPEPVPDTEHECVADAGEYDATTDRYLPAHWTIDNGTGAGNFHINTWSVEADASGMVTPFVEYWVWIGDDKDETLSAATISHYTLYMEPGTYQVSLDARIFSEAGNEIGEGTTLNANDASLDLVAAGTADVYGTETEVYGTYTLICEVGEDGLLDISINIPEGVTYNWIAFKNLVVTPYTGQPEDVDYEIGDVVTIDDVEYTVVGENLFVNGGFNADLVEDENGNLTVPGWTQGNGLSGDDAHNYQDALLAENVTLTEGGYNGLVFMTTASAGASSAKTPTQAIAVEVGKTYMLVAYTSGVTPDEQNLRYSALFEMEDATTEANHYEDDTPYSNTIIQLAWGATPKETSEEWTQTLGVFTATTEYVGMRMGWSSGSYDGFQLYEVEGGEVEPEPEPTYTLVHECVAEVEHWTIAGNTNGDFHYNDWSTEADASGMVVPFLEYWVWSGEGNLSAATISHDTLTGLPEGTYTVVLDARIFSEAGNEIGEGTTLNANGASVDLAAAGTADVYGTETEVYGTYTVTCTVDETGTLDISLEIPEGVSYNWIAFKNLKVYYHGEILSYEFVCTDWGSIDLGRVSDSNVTYDEESNTIIVSAGTGENNVALSNGREAPFTTENYTVSSEQNWFVVVASDIVTDLEASALWWMNGVNDGTFYPDYIVELESGEILVAWDLTATTIDGNLTDDVNYLNGWTGFGLTSTSGVSVVSDINFYTWEDAVEKYPELSSAIATEIAGVETEKVVEGIYTLSGVRISKITKSGIYIVDGKKVLVK